MKNSIALKIIEHNRQVYNTIASDFSLTRGYVWPEFEYFKGYLKNNQAILDLGCGNGRILELLKKYQPNYLGVDNSQDLINESKQKWPDYNFEVGDILNLSKIKEKYDLVFLISVLHHIPSQKLREKALLNIFSVIKPGGKLLMINWNLWQKNYLKYIIKYSLMKISQPKKEIIPGVTAKELDFQDVFMKFFDKKNLRYIHAFNELNVANLLKITGFEIIKNVSNSRNIISIAQKK